MWEQIRANRRKSFWLIVLMALILAAIGYASGEAFFPGGGWMGLLIGIIVFCTQLGVYGLAGETVLMSGLGAREIAREESPRLFNIVEEMQLASGLGYTPRIYLVDSDSPNAFAVGRKPETSAIAVTRGLMYRLNRDELQGVIGHEMAHLKNMDTKFMTLAGVMLGSIIIMSDMAMRMFFYGGGRGRRRSSSRGNGNGNGQAQLIFLVVAILLIVLGPLLARILYFAMSRTREYLADACSAVFTRYPDGLASALLHIATSDKSMGEVNRAVAPMFIVNPLAASGSSDSMFATHPPLEERVRILRGMGGASFVDYNNVFESINGGKSVIGTHTLHESKAQAIRPPSDEGPLETRNESKAAVHRMYGYATIDCQCGARLKIPSSYNEKTVRCIRCGSVYPTPEEGEFQAADAVNSADVPEQDSAADTTPQYIDYTRKTPDAWESFLCQCGGVIQLSPMFAAPMIQCRKCGTWARIHGPENTT